MTSRPTPDDPPPEPDDPLPEPDDEGEDWLGVMPLAASCLPTSDWAVEWICGLTSENQRISSSRSRAISAPTAASSQRGSIGSCTIVPSAVISGLCGLR